MKIRVTFGYLFFLLSIVFTGVQLVSLFSTERPEAVPLILQFFTSSVCLLLASLAAQSDRKGATTAISVGAFSVCFVALLIGGLMAIRSTSEAAPVRYVVFLLYGGLFGFFGLAFSLLASKTATDDRQQDE